MNILQKNIATVIGRHFKRENNLMPRNGPVDLYNEDQNKFIQDILGLFYFNQVEFNGDAFVTEIYRAQHEEK